MAIGAGVDMKKLIKPGQTWYVYMVRCSDDTYYTGVTTDLTRRIAEHNGEMGGGKRGAKYTKARRPVQLVYQEEIGRAHV